jgi:hypothetical protein
MAFSVTYLCKLRDRPHTGEIARGEALPMPDAFRSPMLWRHKECSANSLCPISKCFKV